MAEAVRAAGIDVPARFVEVTGSTNADLLALAASGAPAWSVLVAGHQEAGRGRLGRSWVESPGSSLLVSVLLRPDLPADRGSVLTLAAGVAIVDALADAAAVAATCRWPNDVMLGTRKVAGLLAEGVVEGTRLSHVVVGLGLNLRQRRQDFPSDLRLAPTSVEAEGGISDPGPLLTAFLAGLRAEVARLTADAPALLDRYRARCSTVGHEVAARTLEGRSIRGLATGIGDGGELIVQAPSGEHRLGFGEIEVLAH